MGSISGLWRKIRSCFSGATDYLGLDRRKKRLRCKRCGSADVWRIQSEPGWYADWMRSRHKKPFECRMCKYKFYFLARRGND